MTEHRTPFKRQDSISGGNELHQTVSDDDKSPAYGEDVKSAYPPDDKSPPMAHLNPAFEEVSELEDKNRLANGKERPIETAEDIATR